MNVVALDEIAAGTHGVVGGKAAGLGAMAAAGERVPPGFCLTTAAYEAGRIPEDDLLAAYRDLGGGPVAVRSSATSEDLPEASFAGQQETCLNIRGERELLDAVRRCWDSLNTDRARAYREANLPEGADARMAVVVQRMVDAEAAGVLFTADPTTGSRSAMVVDAASGPGTAVVEGSVVPDHYVLRSEKAPEGPEGGCLGRARLAELYAAGERLQSLFSAPQDVEWAYDRDGVLWLLQSRAITALFPLPPDTGRAKPRFFLEIGNMQGMLRPLTPMGAATMEAAWQHIRAVGGLHGEDVGEFFDMVTVGGRLYTDITGVLRTPWIRPGLVEGLEIYGPRVQAAVREVLKDARFAVPSATPFPVAPVVLMALRFAPTAVGGLLGALARPEAARARAWEGVEDFRRHRGPDESASASQRLRTVFDTGFAPMFGAPMGKVIMPTMAGVVLPQLLPALLKGIASEEEAAAVLTGMPHNVTTEMDLELWRIAAGAAEHRDLLTDTDPAELAARYRAGTLPDIGLDGFLRRYGHRAPGEIDVGVPRWDDDPAPLFATIANYLRLRDAEEAPPRRFERAAANAEATVAELSRRARRVRPVRGRVASFVMHRARELAGMREMAKFAWLIPLAEMRRQLLLAGAELAEQRLLEAPEDIMFLDLDEARAAADHGMDQRELVAERKAHYTRELRRRHVPVALLSDGTDAEALAPPPPAVEGTLTGAPAAAGRATGRARVVVDPVGARIEPGEILVAPTTDPGWTPLFMTAAGLVTETGSVVAHGPTVAREYGIPAVICLPGATQRISTGDVITVDGGTGRVVVEPEESSGTPDADARSQTGSG
ncbi:PEP/pyruvate-binding domain-containing protein [Streptomonospora litoralis]|uniref:Chondramide synthase cmdD n=1 Tax=Streptomonospora litoralis TaxID=2498135 RepID=A0A4V0ZJM9_9ACTN|nr:PEP/pyruvate-binding domain-containing protein [Streptomonospora litoralis]QBI54042.1 Chondramide synthase cmdD [Streptomonospora litoralis]